MSNVKEEVKKISQHGVSINHNNIGLLIQGESGIGKSECAIELINRGAFLISDDIVIIRKDNASLIGESPKETKELIENIESNLEKYDISGACNAVPNFIDAINNWYISCLLYTSPSPRDS